MNQYETKRHTLEDCPEWVQKHSDWTPWETGCDKALGVIRSWNDKHAPQVRDETPLPQLAETDPLVFRLWNCLIHHWESTGRDRSHTEVVANLENEKRPNGDNLGGNPLFDLVLCVALCDKQKKAAEHYGKNVWPHISKTAQYLYRNRFGQTYNDEWQGDFYSYLVEIGRQKDRPLDRFLGLGCLISWLKGRLSFFLRDRFRPGRGEDLYHTRIANETSLTDASQSFRTV